MKSSALIAANIASFTGAIISEVPIMGQITVANSNQYDAANLSQGLTAYMAGQPAPDLESRLDLLFPPVEVDRRFEFQKHDDEAFITETDDSDIRPIGAAFKRIEYRGSTQLAKAYNKGLTYRMDHDQVVRGPDGKMRAGWENAVADNLRFRLIRAELLRGIALLNAGSTPTSVDWSTSPSTANPDGNIRLACRNSLVGKGIKATHLLIGDLAWMLRQDAYEAGARTNALGNHAAYTEDDLARYLGIKTVVREDSLYQTKKGAAKTDIIASLAYVYGAEPGQMLNDASNIKRCWANTDVGQRFGVYVDAKSKFTDITVEHYSTFISPITAGIRKLTIS